MNFKCPHTDERRSIIREYCDSFLYKDIVLKVLKDTGRRLIIIIITITITIIIIIIIIIIFINIILNKIWFDLFCLFG